MHSRVNRLLSIVLALVVCGGAVQATASDRPRRGDYPRCQEECLARLKKTMGDVSGEYEKTGDRLLYENRVEQARYAYDDCIDTCRVRYPVK